MRRPAITYAWLLALSLVAVSAPVRAQRYSFKLYSYQEGLEGPDVRALLQDKNGYLWVGTLSGLYCYDGWRFRAFGEEQGLPKASVWSLYEDSAGTLWVGTSAGLARRKGPAFERVDVGVPHQLVRAYMASDARGTVYVSTARGLAARQPGQRFRLIAAPDPRAAADPYALHVDPAGRLWYGCGTRLCRWDGSRVTVFGPGEGVPSGRWTSILTDSEGRLWAGSPGAIVRLDIAAGAFVQMQADLPQAGTSRALTMDRDGRILASTDGGLARYSAGAWELIGKRHGLPAESVSTAFEDREGSLWVGIRGTGIVRWLGYDEWQSWTTEEGLLCNSIWSIVRDRSGSLWVGSDRGVNRISPRGEVDRAFTRRQGLGSDIVSAIVPAPGGRLWLGHYPGGLSLLDPTSGRVLRYGRAAGLQDDRVLQLALDRENRLWVSTRRGLYRSAPGPAVRFERQHPPGSDDDEMFFQSVLAPDGALWAAGARGLARYSQGAWTRYAEPPVFGSREIAMLSLDLQGQLWLGYRNPRGLARLKFSGSSPVCQRLKHPDAPLSDAVLSLGTDRRGWIWAGTDRGADVYDGKAWRHYDRSDGLVWNDCSSFAFYSDPDGSVWIGTSGGLSRFRPKSRRVNAAPPRIAIAKAMLGGASLNEGEAGRAVPYRRASFTCNFTALTFTNEQRVRFRYRLAGFDDRWVETEDHTVRYAQLPAGRYSFEVLGRDARGAWSLSPARITFRVLPPWWQTWWLRGLVFALLAGGVTAAWRSRTRHLRARQEALETAVRERTAELEHEKAALLQAREALRQQAMRDGLTGLWNRVSVIEFLQRELRRSDREYHGVAVLMLDIDHFKRINDCYGHLVGDAVLRETGARMLAAVRPYDCVGRYGGEEFLIVLPIDNYDSARERAEDVRRSFEREPFHTSGGLLTVTCSVGLAWNAKAGAGAEDIIHLADAALYSAKRQGRNQVVAAAPECPGRARQNA